MCNLNHPILEIHNVKLSWAKFQKLLYYCRYLCILLGTRLYRYMLMHNFIIFTAARCIINWKSVVYRLKENLGANFVQKLMIIHHQHFSSEHFLMYPSSEIRWSVAGNV